MDCDDSWNSSKIISRLDSLGCSLSADPNNIVLLQREHYSTETALQLLLDRIYSTSDEGRPILLVSLELSAAFDIVDHATLLKRLSCSFGVSGVVHSWIESYLYLWQNTVCAHGLTLISCDSMHWDPSLGHYSSLFTLLHCPPLLSPIRSFSSSTQTIRNSMSLCHP